jgi:hypothetical protein
MPFAEHMEELLDGILDMVHMAPALTTYMQRLERVGALATQAKKLLLEHQDVLPDREDREP